MSLLSGEKIDGHVEDKLQLLIGVGTPLFRLTSDIEVGYFILYHLFEVCDEFSVFEDPNSREKVLSSLIGAHLVQHAMLLEKEV